MTRADWPSIACFDGLFGPPGLNLQQPGRLIKQDVDQDARDRHIEPNRKRPPGYSPVLRVAPFEPPKQGQNRERQDYRGQRDMCNEDRKVKRPYEALTGEPDRSNLRVVDQIANQKQRRSCERRDHESPVLFDPPRAHHEIAGDQQRAGDRVEACVDGRKISNESRVKVKKL